MLKTVKHILSAVAKVVAGILLLLFIACIVLQTRPFRKWLAGFAGEKASELVNGTVSIGQISGNLFTRIRVKDILLKDGNDTIAAVAAINVRYNLLALLRQKVNIHIVEIERPFLNIRQDADSTWNVAGLMKQTEQREAGTGNSVLRVEIGMLSINQGRVAVASLNPKIPVNTTDIAVRASLSLDKDKQQMRLFSLSFNASQPDLHLNRLSFLFSDNDSVIELRDIYLKTAENLFLGHLRYSPAEGTGSAAMQIMPLRLGEFRDFISGAELYISPEIALDAYLRNDSLYASVHMRASGQQVVLEAVLPHIRDHLEDTHANPPEYLLRGRLDRVNPAEWSGGRSPAGVINGNLTAEGKGLYPEEIETTLAGSLRNSQIQGIALGNLLFDFHINKGDIRGRMSGSGSYGSFTLSPTVDDVFSSRPHYRFNLVTHNFNMSPLTGQRALTSRINSRVYVSGQGFNPATLSARGQIALTNSKVQNIEVDTLFSILAFGNENIRIDSLRITTKQLLAHATGNYSFREVSDINFNARFEGIEALEDFLPVDSVTTSGALKGRIHKTTDSLYTEMDLCLNKSSWQNNSLDKLTLKGNLSLSPTDTTVTASLAATRLKREKLLLDSLSVEGRAQPDSAFLNARVEGKNFLSSIKTGIITGKNTKIYIPEWIINYEDQNWKLDTLQTVITIDSTDIRIEGFTLIPANANDSLAATSGNRGKQHIKAFGNISTDGKEDFHIDIAGINIGNIAATFYPHFPGSGLFNLNMNLTGTADSPVMNSHFHIDEAMIDNFKINDFSGSVNYRDDKLGAEVRLSPVDMGEVALSGTLPLVIRIDSLSAGMNPHDSLKMALNANQFPLAVIKYFIPSGEVTGTLNGQVRVEGTSDSLKNSGSLTLNHGSIKIPEYGIDYKDIGFTLKLLNKTVDLDSFLIRTHDGTLSAKGHADFKTAFYNGDINNSDFDIRLDKFNPVNHRQLNMQMSGNAALSGDNGKLTFGGNINIPQSDINLRTLMNMLGKVSTRSMPDPILIQEMRRMADVTEITGEQEGIAQNGEIEKTDTVANRFKGVTGSVNIRIPRNSWIRNDDMYIEISGDVTLVKSEDLFELFGTVDLIRGRYNLLGRTFVLNEGTLTFQGGKDINPILDISASHTLRNADGMRPVLSVAVTGTVDAPRIVFKLNDETISEGDALSYMLFGRSINELSADQQSTLAGSGSGNLAAATAASVLSAQLAGYLGSMLNVDYLEIKSEGFENATVMVGKYLTNNLFISYEQRIGERNRQNNMATYEVRLELQVLRFLFLQLNNSSLDSGFDIIYRHGGRRR